MNINYEKLKNNKLFKGIYFFLIFFIFFTTTINSLSWKEQFSFMNVFSNYHDEVCMYLGFVLFVKEIISLLINIVKKNYKQAIKNFVYVFIVILIYYATLKWLYAVYALIVVNARDYKFKDITKLYFYAKLSSFIIWIIAYIFGLINITTFVDGCSFGMYHYNDTALQLSCLFYITWYLYLQNKKVISTIIAIVLAILFIYPIQSRTPVVILLGFIVLIWSKGIFEKIENKSPKVNSIFISYYPLLMFMITVLMCLVAYKYVRYLSGNFISRFFEATISFRNMGLPLTCRTYNAYVQEFLPFVYDNTYIRIMFRYGLITEILFMLNLCLSCKKIYKNHHWGMMVLMIVICTYGVMEYVMKGELLLLLMTYMLASIDKDTIS